jgi:tagatose-1,6-bisphosphate aldolase non-catalytic subunit AgaZ/GatZ
MESLMLSQPEYWSRHYAGTEAEKRVLRHYSLSDRIRYYWTSPQARSAVDRLIATMKGQSVPLPLFWQHMPEAEQFAGTPLDPEAVVIWRVTQSLATYHAACGAAV